jgi:hypothetical protein
MGGPERDPDIDAAAQVMGDDADVRRESDAIPEEAPEPDGVDKAETPGMDAVHEANAEGVNPDA